MKHPSPRSGLANTNEAQDHVPEVCDPRDSTCLRNLNYQPPDQVPNELDPLTCGIPMKNRDTNTNEAS